MFLPLGQLIVARLAQLDKRRPTEREAVDSKPGRTSTKGLRGKCSIWKYICRRLEFLVFSDKDDKP